MPSRSGGKENVEEVKNMLDVVYAENVDGTDYVEVVGTER